MIVGHVSNMGRKCFQDNVRRNAAAMAPNAPCAPHPLRIRVASITDSSWSRCYRNTLAQISFSSQRRQEDRPMFLENVIPLVIVSAVIFGVLWFVVEAAALFGNRRS
jgi:hypothetical protein